MKRNLASLRVFILGGWVLVGLIGGVHAEEDASSMGFCGDEPVACGATEHCCEHVIAMFGEGGATAPSYKEGKCIPQNQSCADFWCGNRHCEAGFFGAPTVCCITARPELPPEYKCSYSELSCPGNTQQLTIRESSTAPSLRS